MHKPKYKCTGVKTENENALFFPSEKAHISLMSGIFKNIFTLFISKNKSPPPTTYLLRMNIHCIHELVKWTQTVFNYSETRSYVLFFYICQSGTCVAHVLFLTLPPSSPSISTLCSVTFTQQTFVCLYLMQYWRGGGEKLATALQRSASCSNKRPLECEDFYRKQISDSGLMPFQQRGNICFVLLLLFFKSPSLFFNLR